MIKRDVSVLSTPGGIISLVLTGVVLASCATSPRQQAELDRLNQQRDIMMSNSNRDRR